MIEIAQTYLGNINNNPELAKLTTEQTHVKVALSPSDRYKGRIHAQTDAGIAVGIIKSRDRALQSGDLFKSDSGQLILVCLPKQELLVLDFSAVKPDVSSAKLVHLGHVLGNHHYPIMMQDNKIYVQLVTERLILEKLIEELNIADLKFKYQTQPSERTINYSAHHH